MKTWEHTGAVQVGTEKKFYSIAISTMIFCSVQRDQWILACCVSPTLGRERGDQISMAPSAFIFVHLLCGASMCGDFFRFIFWICACICVCRSHYFHWEQPTLLTNMTSHWIQFSQLLSSYFWIDSTRSTRKINATALQCSRQSLVHEWLDSLVPWFLNFGLIDNNSRRPVQKMQELKQTINFLQGQRCDLLIAYIRTNRVFTSKEPFSKYM